MTYDVEMEDPAHTFVSENGLVVSNSAHAYCMALDSLYCAWLKAYYPAEFYEVLLQHYSDKGNKDKVILIKDEMRRGFGIFEQPYCFRSDNRKFSYDKSNNTMRPSMLSIKGFSQRCADKLYAMRNEKFDSFIDFIIYNKKNKILASDQMDKLIRINYFKEFGTIPELLRYIKLWNEFGERSCLSKSDLLESEYDYETIKSLCNKETAAQLRDFDPIEIIKALMKSYKSKSNINDLIANEVEILGYTNCYFPDMPHNIAAVVNVDTKYSPKITLYRLYDGSSEIVKVKRAQYDKKPIEMGSIISTLTISEERKWKVNPDKTSSKKFIQIDETEPVLTEWKEVILE